MSPEMPLEDDPEIARELEIHAALRQSARRLIASEHVGAWVTVTYLVLSLLGMIHEAMILARFGLNYIEFAAPSDFLLATVRDPLVILASFVPAAIIFAGLQYLDRRSLKKNPTKYFSYRRRNAVLGNPQFKFGLQLTVAFLWAISFQLQYANRVSAGIRRGAGTKVALSLSNAGIPARPFPADSALLLSVTSNYVFLYFPAQFETRVIPAGNVAYLGRRRIPKVLPTLEAGWTDPPAAPVTTPR